MRNIIFFFVFSSYLFSYGDISTKCCTEDYTNQESVVDYFYPQLVVEDGSKSGGTTECVGEGVYKTYSTPSQGYENDVLVWKQSWKVTTYNCTVPVCDLNETLVNGECLAKTNHDCKALHGFDWVTSDASTVSDCGGKVDGENYTSASFHDSDDTANTSTCCLLPTKPNFDCSVKGDGWTGIAVDSVSDCGAKVDGVLIDSASFESGSEHSDTCCVHAISPDNNDTPSGVDDNDSDSSNSDNENLTNEILGDIKTDIEEGNSDANNHARQAHEDMVANTDSARDNAREAHSDQVSNSGKYDNMIIGLHDIVETNTRIGSQAHSDSVAGVNNDNALAAQLDGRLESGSVQNHEDLSDIKDILSDGKGDADTGLLGLNSGLNSLSESLVTGTDSILGSFSSLSSSYSNTPPVFNGTGTPLFTANIFGGTVVLDLSMFGELRQVFDILFILMLAYLNFKIYRWIFTILLSIGV